MFKKSLSLALISTILIASSPCFAEDPITLPQITAPSTEPDVGAAISPLNKGQHAPFTGVELSPKAVAQIIAELETEKARTEVEVTKAVASEKATCEFKLQQQKIDTDATQKIIIAQLQASQKESTVLRNRVFTLENDQPNLELWVAGGFTVGVALTALTSYVIVKATH